MSYRPLFASWLLAAAVTAFYVVRDVIGPGKWRSR